MNNNIIQPLSSVVLHIRSKDANQLTTDYNTHFSVNLINPITIEKTDEVHISIMSVEMPYSFYNISAELKNNTIVYDTSNTLTITSQDYSVFDLRDFFNADTNFSAIFTTTYDKQKNKLKFLNKTGSSHVINLSSSLINKVIGFNETTTDRTITAGSTLESDYVCNLATVHSILIKSSMGQANVLSTRAGNSTTLQKISVDVNSNGIIYMNQQDYRQVSISQSNVIDLIIFHITDQNNNLLQLQNVNFEFSIIFEIYPRYLRTQSRIFTSNNQNQLNNVSNQIQALNRPTFITEEVNILLNDTHPFQNKSEIKHKAERLILDQLIDQVS